MTKQHALSIRTQRNALVSVIKESDEQHEAFSVYYLSISIASMKQYLEQRMELDELISLRDNIDTILDTFK